MMVDFLVGDDIDQMYAVLLPIVVFLLFYWRRRCVYDLHHSILGNIAEHSVEGNNMQGLLITTLQSNEMKMQASYLLC